MTKVEFFDIPREFSYWQTTGGLFVTIRFSEIQAIVKKPHCFQVVLKGGLTYEMESFFGFCNMPVIPIRVYKEDPPDVKRCCWCNRAQI